MWAVSAIVLSVLLAGEPACYCRGDGVEALGGELRLGRLWSERCHERFDQEPLRWRFENYENKLQLERQTGGGLRVANQQATGDTAFELASPKLAVNAGAVWRFRFHWRAALSVTQPEGHQGHYLSELQWLDAGGREVAATPFAYGQATDAWQTVELTGEVPPGAAGLVIRFGFDQPNLGPGQFLALDHVRYEERQTAGYERAGTVLSRPLRAGAPGPVRWQATRPAGTSLQLRVAGAPDVRGWPGTWSAFVGPDGTPGSSYGAPAALPAAVATSAWLRYELRLTSADGQTTPVVQQVSLGAATDGPWAGLDTAAPVLSDRSATRTADAAAPISFVLRDPSGIVPDSLRVALDGRDVTAQTAREGDRCTFRPTSPLTPSETEADPVFWTVDNYQRALTITREARRSPTSLPWFHVTRTAPEVDTSFTLRSPLIPVTAGERYRVSFWTRHSIAVGVAGQVAWLGRGGEAAGPPTPLKLGAAATDWHQVQVEATAPPGAWQAQIVVGFDSPNLFGGQYVDVAEVAFEGPRPARPDERPNVHRLAVTATDTAGNRLARQWFILVKPPLTTNVVTIRDDGVTLVDGRPFFPIGLYAVWKKPFNQNSFDRAFADLRAAGFNFAHTYNSGRGPDFAEFYAAAQRHGIKLFVASGAGANCTDVSRVLGDVVREESQPALLSWYLADDTASHVSAADLAEVTAAIADVDPAHPTVQADGVGDAARSRYAAFVGATDAFLPEIYPIHGDSPKQVPRVITDMRTIAADLQRAGTRRKAIWAILQHFEGWGWPRYPTRDELWATSYLAIIHGAKGVTWYTYGGHGKNHGVTETPERWREICDLAGELAKLQDVLTERAVPQPPAPQVTSGPARDALDYPSLSALYCEHAGQHWLLVANSAAAPVTGRFAVAGGATVEVPFEGRRLRAEAAGFSDTFRAYGVHVYRW